jgi:hemerythrin superfamily protein
MSETKDLITILVEDHQEVKDLFSRIVASADPEERRDLADRATAELARHSVAEEMYLYPTVKDKIPEGRTLAEQEVEEHAEVERLLKELEGLPGDDASFERVFVKIRNDVLQHVREEEDELFPMLRGHLREDELVELGQRAERAKSTAPTRPHPSSPDTPPLNKLLAPGAGLVDRVRDAVSGRSH